MSCDYCGSECNSNVMPIDLEYDLTQLNSFITSNKEKPIIAFYGGEPTLRVDYILRIMNQVDARAFVIQTNGTLLNRIPTPYITRFHSILVSLDGDATETDRHRGEGSYSRALNGIRYARENGYTGEVIARMTVPKFSDIYTNVSHLLQLTDPKFDYIHWQLDAMWDIPVDLEAFLPKYRDWIINTYNPGISKLIDVWITHLEETGELWGIVPFLANSYNLLTNSKTELPCGAGIDFFSVTTDGRITVCPIPPSVEFAVVGDIFKSEPEDITKKIIIEEPCPQCEIYGLCGGRCIYTNKTKHWGNEGFDIICDATKHLFKELKRVLPILKKLIDERVIDIEDLNYPKIPNGVEIIP